MSANYRISRNLPIRHFIHIYSNGHTEINYFNLKKNELHGVRNLKIEPIFENEGSPKKILNWIKKNYPIRDRTPNDKVFCLIDVDEITDVNIQEGLRVKADFIELILSNPNFELWFLLHFKLYTHQFSIEETTTKLNNFLPEYTKPDVASIFSKLKPHESRAIENAKRLRIHHQNQNTSLFTRASNPHTNIDRVIELINSFV